MKKTLSLLLAALALPACAAPAAPPPEAEEQVGLTVFAAASMTETLTALQPVFEAAHPGVKLVFSFDSSGTLKTQIEEGAACDVFISAGQKQMDQLDAGAGPEANPEGLDFVLPGSRIDLLENKAVLCVPPGTEAVRSFDDLAVKLSDGSILLCMGSEDVPVGQYTQRILAYYKLDETALAGAGCITYASNVKEVATQVDEGSVDAGVIYRTDAYSAGLTPVDCATDEMCGRIVYPAAVINTSAHPALARAYLDFLTTGEAMAVFEAVGFSTA